MINDAKADIDTSILVFFITMLQSTYPIPKKLLFSRANILQSSLKAINLRLRYVFH
jgi:hypothetical protein